MAAANEAHDDDEGGEMFTPRNDSVVPAHRTSWRSGTEGYTVYSASSWRNVGGLGEWVCGYCQDHSTDSLSPTQSDTLADCRQCGRSNRISL